MAKLLPLRSIQKAPKPVYQPFNTWDKGFCLIGACLLGMALWVGIWMLGEMFR